MKIMGDRYPGAIFRTENHVVIRSEIRQALEADGTKSKKKNKL